MIGGEGVAVVLLKRAADAIDDGDHIYALIRGVAVNNDGIDKAGFDAPSVQWQAQVICKALESVRSIHRPSAMSRRTAPARRSAIPSSSKRLTRHPQHTDREQFCGLVR